MSKNRIQLQEEAESLGIDFSLFETNKDFEDAIKAEKVQSVDEGEENEKEEKVEKKSKVIRFETTRNVSFTVNGVVTEGTEFIFDSKEIMEARKKMLVERFGVGIIKE